MMIKWSQIFLCLLLIRCGGIEVGNPHTGDGDEEVSLSIEIADSPLDDVEHIYLQLTSLSLLKDSGQEVALQLTHKGLEPIDILALNNGLSEQIVQESRIPMGSYVGYILRFSPDAPIRVVKNGVDIQPRLTSENVRELVIEDVFELTESDTVVLHMDLLSALKESSGEYVFDPVVSPIRKKRAAAMKGFFEEVEGKGYVCAYREDAKQQQGFVLETAFALRPKARKPSGGRRPVPHVDAHLCENGFAGSRIHETGKFGFHFIPPGTWSLRVHLEDGQIYDSVEPIVLGVGERKRIEVQWTLNTTPE